MTAGRHHDSPPARHARPRTETLVLAALDAVDDLEPTHYVRQHDVAKRELDAVRLEQVAERRGLTTVRINSEIRVFHDSARALGFQKNMSSALLYLDRAVTNRKPLTNRILERAGLPVARGVEAAHEDEVAGAFGALGGPLVVKPVIGSGGRAVSVGLRTADEAVAAAAPILREDGTVLVEEMIASIDLRVAVVAGRTAGATLRVPANVVGDGYSTIAALVEAKNDLRRSSDYVRHQLIRISPAIERFLKDRGLTPRSVPTRGQRVFLHHIANISAGGDSHEILDRLHPDIKALAEAASACFPSAHHAGIDILLERFDAPISEQRVVVCEVNLNNELPMHLYPLYGPSSAVDVATFDAHWGAEATIPAAALDAQDAPVAVSVELAELRALSDAHHDAARDDTQPGTHGIEQTQTAEHLDDALLRTAVDALLGDGERSWTTAGGRLVHMPGMEGEHIGERTGRTVLAGVVGANAEVMHRYADVSGIPVMARHWLRAEDLEKATQLAARRWRRWQLRFHDPDGQLRLVPVGTPADVHDAWHQVPRSERFRMIEVPTGPACVLLMRGEQFLTAQLRAPLTVRGDGLSTLASLVDAELVRRQENIALTGVTPGLSGEALIAGAGLEAATVVARNERVEVGQSPRVQDGAATIGLAEMPWPGLEALADRFNAAVGNGGIATMAFVPRRRSATEATWALWEFQSEPALAQFRYPLSGPEYDAYPEVAHRIVTGPRRQIASP